MVTEAILTTLFVLGAPLWLAVEELLHRPPAPRAQRSIGRRAVPAGR